MLIFAFQEIYDIDFLKIREKSIEFDENEGPK